MFTIGGTGQLGTGITNDTFANINGLSGAETYTFYVRSLCGPTGFSRWAGPFKFTTDPSCGDQYHYFLNGSSGAFYDTSAYFVTTLCPDQPGVALSVNLATLSVGPGDNLRIYNGNSLLSPPLDTLTGSIFIGNFRSTTSTGCLTFEFISDTIVSPIDLGWLFNVTCAPLDPNSCYKVLQLDSVGSITSTMASFHWADMFGSPNYNYQLLELPQPPAPINSNTVADTFVTFNNLVPGTRYRLLVQSACINGINSVWDTIEFVTPLDCGTIELGCDAVGETYSRSGTGLWYTPEKACNPNNPTPTPGKEQLFTFIAPNTKAYSLEMYMTTNSGVFVTYYYKEMALGCDSLNWICIDDFGPLGSAPMGSTNQLIAGKSYLILADAQSTTAVQQKFRIKDCGPPSNDLAENAVLIELGVACDENIYANDGATYSIGEPDPDAEIALLDSVAGRWLEGADKTVWFKFIAPNSETVTIYTNQKQLNPNEDTQVALYEVGDPLDFSTFKLLESDEDNGNNIDNLLGFNSVFSYTGLVPLQTYYIQVDGWGAKGEGTFCIRVAEAAERAVVGDCLDLYGIAVDSGSTDWYNLYATPDDLDIGLLVAAINPNGNDLDSVFYQIRVAPSGDSAIYGGIPHMRAYINIQTKNPPLASMPVSIRLFYTDAELAELKIISNAPNADFLDLVVSHHNGPKEDCEFINNGGPFGTIIDNFNQRYQLDGSFYLDFNTPTLGEFVARLSDIALPLELLTFRGEAMDVSNRLFWTTATEQNVEWHRVERSINGVTWSETGKIAAQNQMGVTMSYQFDDANPPQTAYYRLRSTDFDGMALVSPVIQIVRAIDKLSVTALYPSPTTDRIMVQYFVPQEDKIELRLTDLNGRIVLKQTFDANDGMNQQEISLAQLPVGLYMITIHNSLGSTEPLRVVKQ